MCNPHRIRFASVVHHAPCARHYAKECIFSLKLIIFVNLCSRLFLPLHTSPSFPTFNPSLSSFMENSSFGPHHRHCHLRKRHPENNLFQGSQVFKTLQDHYTSKKKRFILFYVDYIHYHFHMKNAKH